MTIAAEMVVPGLIGHWLDTKFGTRAVFLLIGFAVGRPVGGPGPGTDRQEPHRATSMIKTR